MSSWILSHIFFLTSSSSSLVCLYLEQLLERTYKLSPFTCSDLASCRAQAMARWDEFNPAVSVYLVRNSYLSGQSCELELDLSCFSNLYVYTFLYSYIYLKRSNSIYACNPANSIMMNSCLADDVMSCKLELCLKCFGNLYIYSLLYSSLIIHFKKSNSRYSCNPAVSSILMYFCFSGQCRVSLS